MKSYYKIFLWIFMGYGIPTGLCSQNLFLSGDAKISLKSDGIVFSSPSIKLKDSSQIIHAENVTLTQKNFIEILSPKASIKTKEIEKGEVVSLSIGIASKSVLNLRPSDNSVSYSIGMAQSEEDAALPFKWNISASSNNQELKTGIDFSWEKAIEPADFDLKALLIQENGAWELPLNQQVGEGMISLVDFSDFEQEGSFFTVKNFTRDTDKDEVPDIIEIRESTDLNDPGAYLDSDGDGVPDHVESRDGTDSANAAAFTDSDLDGVSDYVEVREGTDPNDGCQVVLSSQITGAAGELAWQAADCDGDGLSNGYELALGDTDKDGVLNYLDADDDGDGLPTAAENADPNGDGSGDDALDSNNNGVPDYLEFNAFAAEKATGLDVEVFNAMSPNGDGLNDVLVIRNIGMYPDNQLMIFNRRGQVVYEAKGYGQGDTFFDGRSSAGGLLPSGNYFYALRIQNTSQEVLLTGMLYINY